MGVEGTHELNSRFEWFLLSPTLTLDSPLIKRMKKMEVLATTLAASVSPVRTMSETQR